MYTIGGHGGNGGAQDDAWCTPLDVMVVMEELKMTRVYTIGCDGGNGGAQDDAWCTPLDVMVVMEELKMRLGVHHWM